MTLSKPTPGNTIAKIDEMIDAINAGSGGGGGSTDLIQVPNSRINFATIPESGDTIIELDPAIFGGIFYRVQGTSLSWGGVGNETKINVNEDGYYSIKSVLVASPGSEGMTVTSTIYVNGTPTFFAEFGPAWVDVLAVGGASSHAAVTKLPLNSGDVIEVHATQVGNVSNDNQVGGYTLVVSKDV